MVSWPSGRPTAANHSGSSSTKEMSLRSNLLKTQIMSSQLEKMAFSPSTTSSTPQPS